MRAEAHDESEIFIFDDQGNFWVPGAAAQEYIEEAEDHEQKALELCEKKPCLGVWFHE